MVQDVIDNSAVRMTDRVRDLLHEGADAARFVVGYLFLDGLVSLQDEISRLADMQILIGNVVNRLTDEQLREEAVSGTMSGMQNAPMGEQDELATPLREARQRAAAVTALNLRRTIADMPRNDASKALLLTLASRIVDGGLKVRLYTQGRIHAKLTLIAYPDREIAIVGSSNLTLGSAAHPTEMNVVVRDAESVQELERWYAGLWDESQDFHRELFAELGQCWAMPALSGLA